MIRAFWRKAVRRGSFAVALLALGSTAVGAHEVSGEPAPGQPSVYAPYAFLIGAWDVAPASGGKPFAVSYFKWGPHQSYIWYSTSSLDGAGQEDPHFEGILAYNGVRKNLDMLVELALGGSIPGSIEETGTVSIQADGTVLRDITAIYAEGARPRRSEIAGATGWTGHFHHTFRADGPTRVLMSMTMETEQGWVPTFPGSDRIVMTRRSTP
jgi:hypothetical protein